MSIDLDDNYQTLYQELNEFNIDIDPLDAAKNRLKICASAGFLLHTIPAAMGGHEDSFSNLCRVNESLGYHVRDPGLILSIHAHLWGCVYPIMLYGSDEQKQKYLPSLLSGEMIGAYAFNEPNPWSKAINMKSQAEKHQNLYKINAHKRFVVNCPISQVQIVYACIEGSVSAFLIEETDEVELLDMLATEGFVNASMGDLMLTGCQLDESRLLGVIGEGKEMIRFTREMERVFVFSGLIGVLKWQLEEISVYIKTRKMHHKSSTYFQTVDHKVVNMRMRLDTMRLWVHYCASLKDKGEQITMESAEAKIFCAESFLQSTLEATELIGAIGVSTDDFFIQSILDGITSKFISGSVEYQRDIIAKHLGLG
jgi:alkylation response protein AidB-like acyl-CoA dehydrogenase